MRAAPLLLLLSLTLSAASIRAEQVWRYDMLVNRSVIGEQTLQHIHNAQGTLLVQQTNVEKDGWFSSFSLQGVSVEQLDTAGASLATQTRVTANGKTWWSQTFPQEDGLRGTGRDLGELDQGTADAFATLDAAIASGETNDIAQLRQSSEDILRKLPGEASVLLPATKPFVTSLNALPFYLKRAGRIPGALQLLDNEGLQVINSPIVDLGTQSMEIGGKHYKARHVKIEKADAGTHIWFNTEDKGPVLLMIAGKSGKKKFQISLKHQQDQTH